MTNWCLVCKRDIPDGDYCASCASRVDDTLAIMEMLSLGRYVVVHQNHKSLLVGDFATQEEAMDCLSEYLEVLGSTTENVYVTGGPTVTQDSVSPIDLSDIPF